MKKLAIAAAVTSIMMVASTAAAATFTYDYVLRYGMRGAEVVELQQCLNSIGYNVGYADGVFGNMTLAGVKAFQADHSLTPDGVVGPMTGHALEAACSGEESTTTTTTTSTNNNGCQEGWKVNPYTGESCVADDTSDDDVFEAANGEEGDISDITVEAADDADALRPDEKDQLAYKVKIEADEDGSDIQIRRFTLDFDLPPVQTGGEDDLYDIFDKITVKVDGEEVASKDADDDSDWRDADEEDDAIRISGINTVVKAGEEKEFEIYVDTQDLDSGDLPIELKLEKLGVLFLDEAGIYTDVDEATDEHITIKEPQSFDMSISEDEDKNPDDTVLNLSEDIDKQLVLAVEAEANDGDDDQGGKLKELKATVQIEHGPQKDNPNAGDEYEVRDLLDKMYVYIDGDKIDDDRVASSVKTDTNGKATIEFNFDLDDYKVKKGDKIDVELKADFNEIDSDWDGATVQVTKLVFQAEGLEDGDDVQITKDTSSFAPVFTASMGALVTENVDKEGLTTASTGDVAEGTYTVEFKADGDEDITIKKFIFALGKGDNTTEDKEVTKDETINVTGNHVSYSFDINEDDEDGDDIDLANAADGLIEDGDTRTYYFDIIAKTTDSDSQKAKVELKEVVYTVGSSSTELHLKVEEELDDAWIRHTN